MVELRNIKKSYGEKTVLDVDHLRVESGERLALAGANGSGKTTLLRILAGLLKPDSGSFSVPERILYMPQRSYAFSGDLSRNLSLGRKGVDVDGFLEKVGLLELKEKKAKSLSGGELQRLSFARILSREAELLLLDEPTSACDAEGAGLIVSALKDYAEKTGCTVIFSTHAPSLAVKVATRLILLNEGKVDCDGKPRDLLLDPKTDRARAFVSDWKI